MPRSQGSPGVSQETYETVWKTTGNSNGQITFVPCCDDPDWERKDPGNTPFVEQSLRKFTPTISTKRAGNAELQALAKFAEVYIYSRIHP
tara:strand:- start:8272 stop:8541 length:270 start_codon:yes stop_codon:yes gene_type:complete